VRRGGPSISKATLRERLGELAPPRLRFAVGPLPEPPPETSAERVAAAQEPTAEDLREAERLVAELDDENLRKVVARAAALSLAKARSDR
jgi:hypothetical protein